MTEDELLRDEYIALLKIIDDFDNRALTIKAWSVTLSAAALSIAFVEDQRTVLLIAAGSAAVFWVIEALWKASQRAYYPRVSEIESHFASPPREKTFPFKVNTSRRAAFSARNKEKEALRIMTWPHVFLPHLAVAVAGILLYLAYPCLQVEGKAADEAKAHATRSVTPPPSAAPR